MQNWFSSLNMTFSQSLIVHNECTLVHVHRLLRWNSVSKSFGHALQPHNPISCSLFLTALGHTIRNDVKVHCFKICYELRFLFESEILCNKFLLSSRKDVFLDRPDQSLLAIEFVLEISFQSSHDIRKATCYFSSNLAQRITFLIIIIVNNLLSNALFYTFFSQAYMKT